MGRFLQFLFIALSFFLLTSVTYGCVCVNDPLPKRFKKAKAVFIAEVIEKEPDDKPVIQNNEHKGTQVVKVIKSWKGVKKDFVAVNFAYESPAHCPTLYYFEKNKQYLVFAYGNKLEVRTVCSDTWEIPQDKENFGYEQMQDYIKKLDSFWFRFWANINPFI